MRSVPLPSLRSQEAVSSDLPPVGCGSRALESDPASWACRCSLAENAAVISDAWTPYRQRVWRMSSPLLALSPLQHTTQNCHQNLEGRSLQLYAATATMEIFFLWVLVHVLLWCDQLQALLFPSWSPTTIALTHSVRTASEWPLTCRATVCK